jgi:organic radical activating enzyme
VDGNLGCGKISDSEIVRVIAEIRRHQPQTLIFTGGEPTLYIKEIDRILSAIVNEGKKEIKIITNGAFAKSPESAGEVLASIRGLSGVAMSYDRFHSEFIPATNVHNLAKACRMAGLRFTLMSAVQSPLDLAFLNSLKLSEVHISIQKILSIGSAKKNGLRFEYPEFEPAVLGKKCPNLGGMVFNCGSGFTVCCGFFGSMPSKEKFVHGTISEHLRSRFYKLISKHTFGELLNLAGISADKLTPEHSDPCTLCFLAVQGLLKVD